MSASRDGTASDCALFERKATSMCSACKSIWFCSKQCQTTLWPVHKSLCKADPAIFRQAPLTKQELADFDNLSTGMYTFGPGAPPEPDAMPIRQTLLAATSLRDWPAVLNLLPVRHADFLYPFQQALASNPYYMTDARVAYGIVIMQDGQVEPATKHLIRDLNAFFRQLLIQGVVDYHVMRSTAADMIPWLPLLYLARDRAFAALEKSNVDPLVAARLRPLLLDKYEELRYMMWREDGTTPPAVHP